MTDLSIFASEVPIDNAATTRKPLIVNVFPAPYTDINLGYLHRFVADVSPDDLSVTLLDYHYVIERKTNACDVIYDEYVDKHRFVQRSARKRFAYDDRRLALHSLHMRTQHRVSHAQYTLDRANTVNQVFNTYALEALLNVETSSVNS